MEESLAQAQDDRPHALRIKLSVRYVLILQRLRFTRGTNATQVVQEALDLYFERIGLPREKENAQPGRIL